MVRRETIFALMDLLSLYAAIVPPPTVVRKLVSSQSMGSMPAALCMVCAGGEGRGGVGMGWLG
eukprot:710900-Pelagomonas_calceolata.AAC.1